MTAQYTFASFTWPRVFYHHRGTIAKRLADYKQSKKPGCSGPYHLSPGTVPGASMFSYLDSDFELGLRWEWCDVMAPLAIDHKGWFTDPLGDSVMGTARGVVWRLPRRRGFLIGWSLGESMATETKCKVVFDAEMVAVWADNCAEQAAEKEREYHTTETAKFKIEEAQTLIGELREEMGEITDAVRKQGALQKPLCDVVRSRIGAIHCEVRAAIKEINTLRDDPYSWLT